MSEPFLIGHGWIVTRGKAGIVEDGAVLVSGGRIAGIGKTREMCEKHPKAPFVYLAGRTLLPGFINAHTHLYSTFARGMALKDPPPRNFIQILERLWWRLDKALTPRDVELSALVALIDNLRCGTTTLFDHHASPHAAEGSLDLVESAFRRVGMRGVLCYEVSDRDGRAVADAGIAENVRFLGKARANRDGLIAALFGLHASFTVGDKTLERARAAADGAGFHIHVAEDAADLKDSERKHRLRTVMRLSKHGIAGPRSIFAHGVHTNARELRELADTGTVLVTNPQSNLGNAVGALDLPAALREGVRCAVGTDGFTPSIPETMKALHCVHRHTTHDPQGLPWDAPTEMGLGRNAEVARQHLFASDPAEKGFGTLTVGARADLVAIDYVPPTPMTAANLTGHFHFGLANRPVTDVWIGGERRLEAGRIPGIDEVELAARARELAKKLWKRF